MRLLRHYALLAFVSAGVSLHAAIVVTKTAQGYQFADATSIVVNGKDKVLSTGKQAKPAVPLNKLPNTHLTGTVLKDADAGSLGLYADGMEYILPEGLPKTTAPDPAEIWKSARVSYKKSANDKTPTDVPATEFVAFLPGGTEELAHLCRDERQLETIGGKGKAFATEMELMAAVARAYPTDAAVAKLERFVEQAMRQRYDDFEKGAAGLDVLQEALKISELSAAVYPKSAEQEKLRTALSNRKAWLDRRVAVLRALSAGKEWDAFLLADKDFEAYRHSFPEMVKMHTDALTASLQLHRQNGEVRFKENEFGTAWREFRIASMRQPSDKVLQTNTSMAWTDYSRQVAIDAQGKQKQLTAGQREAIKQALLFARNYKTAGKLDEALKSVNDAEGIDADALQVLLTKAEVLGAQHEFNRAMAALDAYDLRAVNEERDPAGKLRAQLLYERTSMLADVKVEFQKAWAESSFHKAYAAALKGLRAKDDDADFLYGAGLTAVILRKPEDGRNFFKKYLEAANTLDANAEQRVKVRALLGTIVSKPPESGAPNWLSGKQLPPNVYYCPASLAFQTHIDRVEASGKMKVAFDWNGDRLKSIAPSFEKADKATGERKITFAYAANLPQVANAGYDDGVRSGNPDNPDEFVKQSPVVLENNPFIDPAAIQRFTGKTVAIGIAGNRFFDPFVWDKIHYFQLTYDGQGRVSEAREMATPNSAPGDFLVRFEWDGQQLDSITAYEGKNKIYQRDMQYEDGRLVAEEIQAQGKTSHTKYVYNGGRMVSATTERNNGLDDRSRQVFFR